MMTLLLSDRRGFGTRLDDHEEVAVHLFVTQDEVMHLLRAGNMNRRRSLQVQNGHDAVTAKTSQTT